MDRNTRQAFSELNTLKDKLAIPDAVMKRASRIYTDAHERDLVRGRSISEVVAAALYAACRDTATPRNLKDVEHAANVKRRSIERCYRVLVKELDLKMPVADPAQFVSRIAGRISVSKSTERRAVSVLKRARNNGALMGKDPMGLAAAALYLACVKNGEIETQRNIAKAANVTEVTVRNRYMDLRRFVFRP